MPQGTEVVTPAPAWYLEAQEGSEVEDGLPGLHQARMEGRTGARPGRGARPGTTGLRGWGWLLAEL